MYEQLIEIVKQAGAMIREAHEAEIPVYDKEGIANFVTKYDKDVQSFLIRNFRQLLPEANFLAEEDGIRQELGDGYCFIIDPIDGTTNFIFDYKFSCVSVGLAWKGRMQFGVVYNPYTEELYTAIKGEGAYKNGKRIHSSEKGLGENLAAFGCARYNSNETNETDRILRYAKILYLHTLAIRSSGSAALDICRVASGSNGIYVELMLHPWDYAAASLILMEAGGFISTLEGGMVTLDRPCSVIAAGRQCWKEATQLFKEADRN